MVRKTKRTTEYDTRGETTSATTKRVALEPIDTNAPAVVDHKALKDSQNGKQPIAAASGTNPSALAGTLAMNIAATDGQKSTRSSRRVTRSISRRQSTSSVATAKVAPTKHSSDRPTGHTRKQVRLSQEGLEEVAALTVRDPNPVPVQEPTQKSEGTYDIEDGREEEEKYSDGDDDMDDELDARMEETTVPFDAPSQRIGPADLRTRSGQENDRSNAASQPNFQVDTVNAASAATGAVSAMTGVVRTNSSAPMLNRPHDVHKVDEYIDDIFSYLRNQEQSFRPRPNYMARQRDINHSMRSILVDWLVEVATEYRLMPNTLFTSVGYIDRFLSELSVQKGKLQLIGVTCMLLAAKYEEIYPPAIDEFVYITDRTYSREQILKMEYLVLKVLKFDMGGVHALSFVNRYFAVINASPHVRCMTLYLTELTLQNGEQCLDFLPSIIAAASICVALHTFQSNHWPASLQMHTGYSSGDIHECVGAVWNVFRQANNHPQQAIRFKYSSARFYKVATHEPMSEPPPL